MDADDALSLDKSFRRFLDHTGPRLMWSLPDKVRYYPLIEKCYGKVFYNYPNIKVVCPGPARCDIPPMEGMMLLVLQRLNILQNMGA